MLVQAQTRFYRGRTSALKGFEGCLSSKSCSALCRQRASFFFSSGVARACLKHLKGSEQNRTINWSTIPQSNLSLKGFVSLIYFHLSVRDRREEKTLRQKRNSHRKCATFQYSGSVVFKKNHLRMFSKTRIALRDERHMRRSGDKFRFWDGSKKLPQIAFDRRFDVYILRHGLASSLHPQGLGRMLCSYDGHVLLEEGYVSKAQIFEGPMV